MTPRRSGEFRFTNRVVNPVMRRLLRGPLGRRLGRHLAVLRYQGRRTGRTRELVVQYVREGDQVWIVPGSADRKQWWRNLIDPRPVELWLAGRHLDGVARIIGSSDDPKQFTSGLTSYRAGFPRVVPTPVIVRIDLIDG